MFIFQVRFLNIALTIFFCLLSQYAVASTTNFRHKDLFEPKINYSYALVNAMYVSSFNIKDVRELNVPNISPYSDALNRVPGYRKNLTDSSFGFALGGGYKTNSPLRFDMTFVYLQGEGNLATSQSPLSISGSDYNYVKLLARNMSLNLNAFFDLDFVKVIVPYFGYGLGFENTSGIVRIGNNGNEAFRSGQRFSKLGIGQTIHLGFLKSISNRVTLDVAYNYRTNIYKFGTTTYVGNSSYQYPASYTASIIKLGLIFKI